MRIHECEKFIASGKDLGFDWNVIEWGNSQLLVVLSGGIIMTEKWKNLGDNGFTKEEIRDIIISLKGKPRHDDQ